VIKERVNLARTQLTYIGVVYIKTLKMVKMVKATSF